MSHIIQSQSHQKTVKQVTAKVAQPEKSNSMFESLEDKINQLTTGRDISKMTSLNNTIGEDAEEEVIVLEVIINNLLQVKKNLMRYKGVQVIKKGPITCQKCG